jgi:hypothetical protein
MWNPYYEYTQNFKLLKYKDLMNHHKKLDEIKTRKNKFEKENYNKGSECNIKNKLNTLVSSNCFKSTKVSTSLKPTKKHDDSTLKLTNIQNSNTVLFLYIDQST